MLKEKTHQRTGRAGLALLAILLVPALTSTEAIAQDFGIGPDPIVMIIWDRSSSMDFTIDWQIPAGLDCNDSCADANDGVCNEDTRGAPGNRSCDDGTDCTDCGGEDVSLCDPDVEYARTRNLLAREVFTGSYSDFCAVRHGRPYSADGRDRPASPLHPDLSIMQHGLRGALWPHTEPASNIVQRRDGILDRFAEQVFFGFATWDVDFHPGSGFVGDYSYPLGLGFDTTLGNTDPELGEFIFGWNARGNDNGPAVTGNPNAGRADAECNGSNWSLDNIRCYVDMGLANFSDPMGGMVNPMPLGGFPSVPGGLHAIRLGLNQAVQDRINSVVPSGSSPISSALQDLVWFQYHDSTTTSEPFAQCRPIYFLFITDGPSWETVTTGYQPGDVGVVDCVNGCSVDADCPASYSCNGNGNPQFCSIPEVLDCVCTDGDDVGDACTRDNQCGGGGVCDTCTVVTAGHAPCSDTTGGGGRNEVRDFLDSAEIFTMLTPWELDPEEWFSAGLWHVLTNQRYWKPDIELRWGSGGGRGSDAPVDTYFIGFATHDAEYVHDLARQTDNCAFDYSGQSPGPNDPCAYIADSQAALQFTLGAILNFFESQQIRGGEISLIPPLIHTTLEVEGSASFMSLHRFRASSVVNPLNAAFWGGQLKRETWTCQGDANTGTVGLALDTDLSIDFHDQFTPERISPEVCGVSGLDCDETIAPRTILVGRPDVVGRACGEYYGFNHYDGAVADPALDASLGGYGDGTGGVDAGGAGAPNGPTDVVVVAVELEPIIDCTEDEAMLSCLIECDGTAECLCHCQVLLDCGACVYAGGSGCETHGYGDCVFGCSENLRCIDSCQTIFDCGTGVDFDGVATEPGTAPTCENCSRDVIDAHLLTERLSHGVSGNDDALPYFPDFDFEELDEDGDCALELTTDVFADSDDELWAMLFADSQDEAAGIVNFTRGARLADLRDLSQLPDEIDPVAIQYMDREPEYGVIPGALLHSSPALILPPTAVERLSPGWVDFVLEYGVGGTDERASTLVIGGNDAQVHAFDIMTGEELWSFIPPSFLPQLRELMLGHRITVDGDIVVKNLRCEFDEDTEEWCTLLAVSYRSGGSGVMILDVTDVQNPTFVMEVTGQDIPELGLSHPRPILGNMQVLAADDSGTVRPVERPVLILGGGRPLSGPEIVLGGQQYGSHEGEILVIMDALTGQIYKQFDPISDPYEFSTCGPITSGVAPWPQHIISRVYMGTQYGCLLRADLSHSDPSNWSFEILDRASHFGEISHTPSVAPGGDNELVVLYGTGNLDWSFDHVTQEGSLVSITENIIASAADDVSYAAYAFDGVTVNYEMLFDQGEFITSPPIIYNGNAYFATYIPNAVDVCNTGGSRIYGIDYIGDPAVDGGLVDDANNALATHIVRVGSDRIIGVFDNPLAGQDGQPDIIKFLGEGRIGYGNIAFNVSLQSVPDCSTFTVDLDGNQVSIAGASTTRRLQIDFLQQPDAADPTDLSSTSTTNSMADATSTTANSSYGVLTLEQDIPAYVMAGIELDWGPVLGQSHTFGYRGF